MRHNRIPHNLKLTIRTAAVFEPLLDPARYKGIWGGRGSGKSHFAGGMAAEDALAFPGENQGEGLRMVCIREVQKSLKESSKRMIEDKLREFGLGEAQGFKLYHDRIGLPGDGIMIFEGMQDHSADSIKSLEGYHRAWVEEAQTLSERSLMMLRPTIRTPASELWFTWNPRRPTDAVDQMLRGENVPTGAVVIRSNWSDNPWFPKELEQERVDCLRNDPANYDHIWEGGYATVQKGAYYAGALTTARLEGRIRMYPRDPLQQIYAFWDIGGTGDKSDATAIWFVQFLGEEVRVLADYEAVGQPFSAHVNWIRKHDFGDATMVLPHDGRTHDKVYRITPEAFLRDAGFDVTTLDNGGKGAAMMRVEETRKIFGGFTFNEETTKGGREALGWYHEKIDPNRGIGLGPEHDWACLPAGTLILTPGGPKPVERFKPGDRVITAGKVGNVVRAQYVKDSPIYSLLMLDGSVVNCSPEHKIFTKRGLVMAKDLACGDVLLQQHEVRQWLVSKSGIRGAFIESTMASGIGTGKSEGSMSVKREASRQCCTASYGNPPMARFLQNMQLFLSMGIGSVLTLIIGSVVHTPATARSSSPFTRAWSLTGNDTTKRQTALISTTLTTKGKKRYSIGIFMRSITDRFQMVLKCITKTLTPATTPLRTLSHSAPKTIVKCTVSEKKPVYDIEVEHDHAYTLYESNVVTSNSHSADAFGNIAVFKKMRMGKRKAGKGPVRRNLKGIA